MKDTAILLTRFGMGQTDNQELSTKLIQKYFSLLLEGGQLPPVICFYTDGVKLVPVVLPSWSSSNKWKPKVCASSFAPHASMRWGLPTRFKQASWAVCQILLKGTG
jgi:hypothetical protein